MINRMKSSDIWRHCPNSKLLRWRSMAKSKIEYKPKVLPSGRAQWHWNRLICNLVPSLKSTASFASKSYEGIPKHSLITKPSPTVKSNFWMRWPKQFLHSRQKFHLLLLSMQKRIRGPGSATTKRRVLQRSQIANLTSRLPTFNLSTILVALKPSPLKQAFLWKGFGESEHT